jgi:hypothetical protein
MGYRTLRHRRVYVISHGLIQLQQPVHVGAQIHLRERAAAAQDRAGQRDGRFDHRHVREIRVRPALSHAELRLHKPSCFLEWRTCALIAAT